MNHKRIQLTLFIDGNEATEIERIRKEFNSEQYDLIKAHVTLCREDELEQIEKVITNLKKSDHACITVYFVNPVRVSDGKGVLLSGAGNNEPFQNLREKILNGIIETPRIHEPHITLMHPRNAACTDEIFAQIEKYSFPKRIEFKKISLIEQEPGMKWSVLKEFELRNEAKI
jgi:asparagine synthetase B (glutamine-hydrolysing)